MEVAGLAVGVASLAGLFSCCTSAFRLVQQGRSFDKDYKLIETKFGNQELRLRAWGRACGLVNGTNHDQRLYDPVLIQQVEASLECIKLLLGDAKELKGRYGLRSYSQHVNQESRPPIAIHSSSEEAATIEPGRRASLTRLLSRRSLLQRRGSSLMPTTEPSFTLATAHWIVEDREKFSGLVQHLRDLIDDLENITKATEIPRRQRVFVEYEVESIDDFQTLEDMETAREGDDDAVSDAASARLERLSEGTASVRSSIGSGRNSLVTLQSIITLESLDSYFTARTHFSRPDSIADSEYLFPTPELSRVVGLIPYDNTTMSNRLLTLQAHPRNDKELIRRRTLEKNGDARARLKCTIVGEASARKTELLSCFTFGGFPTAHMPLVFKERVTECRVDGQLIDVALWDTAGQEDYDQLRRNSYSGAHIVIICFLINPEEPNYDQVRHKWITEVNERCPKAGRVIVGVEPDGSYRTSRMDITRGKRLAAEVSASHYIQCNLESGAGVDDVFEAAIRANIASSGADVSRPWKFPWRGARRKLSTIEENSVSRLSQSKDNAITLSFEQNQHRKGSSLSYYYSAPSGLTNPLLDLRDSGDSTETSGEFKYSHPLRLYITNADDPINIYGTQAESP